MLSVSEGMEEIAVSVQLFVPFLDKRRCFLCCWKSPWGSIVKEKIYYLESIIRILDCLAGLGRTEMG